MCRRPAQMAVLLLCLLGWTLVGCTLAMDHWRGAQLGGQGGSSVVETAWFWSDLWKDCYEDSTMVVNCVDFRVLWTVKTSIQAVRGLLVIGLCLGLIGTVLIFLGMECTRIGGDQIGKDRMLITASAFHLLGCASDVIAYCLYINRVAAAVLHSSADPSTLRYEMGAPLYVGLVGSFLILLGCTAHCVTACRVKQPKSRRPEVPFAGERGEKEREHIGGRSKRSHDPRIASHYKITSVVVV